MSKILITGGAGFIGSSLIEKLKKDKGDIIVIDNLSKQIHGDNWEDSFLYKKVKDKAIVIKGDVCDPNIYEQLPSGIDCVVHLAAETGTGQSMYEIKRYSDVNVSGTALLLEKVVVNNPDIKKVILASSRAIFGEGKYKNPKTKETVYPDQRLDAEMQQGIFNPVQNGVELTILPTDENAAFKPSSVYGVTKLSQELLVMNVCESIKVSSIALRFQNVYGPGQSLKNPYTGILSIFSNLLLKNKAINIFEDGEESRDFVYIDDVVDSILLSMKNDEIKNEVFNVGTGVATPVIQVAKLLKQYYQSDSEINISGNYRVGDIRHNKADISKIKSMLGFQPKNSFESGLRHFTKWVQTQQLEESHYEASLEEMKKKGLFK